MKSKKELKKLFLNLLKDKKFKEKLLEEHAYGEAEGLPFDCVVEMFLSGVEGLLEKSNIKLFEYFWDCYGCNYGDSKNRKEGIQCFIDDFEF